MRLALVRSLFVAPLLSVVLCASTAFAQASLPASASSLRLQNGSQTLTLNIADLQPLAHVTVTVHNPHSNKDEIYSGVALIDLLAKIGAPRGKELRGKALADYVIATGSDGYKAVLSLAEIDPALHPGQILVADTMDAKPLDPAIGPFRLVVTEDKRPARSVHNLVSLELRQAD